MTNEFRAAAWTALFSFVALFGASLIGWVQTVVEWANAGGVDVFPDVSVLGKAAVSAAAAALAGLLNYVVRFAQSKQLIPGSGPQYPPS